MFLSHASLLSDSDVRFVKRGEMFDAALQCESSLLKQYLQHWCASSITEILQTSAGHNFKDIIFFRSYVFCLSLLFLGQVLIFVFTYFWSQTRKRVVRWSIPSPVWSHWKSSDISSYYWQPRSWEWLNFPAPPLIIQWLPSSQNAVLVVQLCPFSICTQRHRSPKNCRNNNKKKSTKTR